MKLQTPCSYGGWTGGILQDVGYTTIKVVMEKVPQELFKVRKQGSYPQHWWDKKIAIEA